MTLATAFYTPNLMKESHVTQKKYVMCYNPVKIYINKSKLRTYHPFVQGKAKFDALCCSLNGVDVLTAPCGKCDECLQTKRIEWTKRILIDVLSLKSRAFFVTLTYNSENVPIIPFGKKFRKYQTKEQIYNIYTLPLSAVCEKLVIGNNDKYISHVLKNRYSYVVPEQPANKRWQFDERKLRYTCRYGDYEPQPEHFLMVHNKYDVDKFLKRLRINLKRSGMDMTGKLKYALVSEYGCEGERPHYHLIVYGFPLSYSVQSIKEVINLSWDKGFTKIENASVKNIRYICKYMYSKSVVPLGCPHNLRFFSSGIGSDYDETKLTVNDDGTSILLPLGKNQSFKWVSIPLACKRYQLHRNNECILYKQWRRKQLDRLLSAEMTENNMCSLSKCKLYKAVKFQQNDIYQDYAVLPRYCNTADIALKVQYFRQSGHDYLNSSLDTQEAQLEQIRLDAKDLERCTVSLRQKNSALPASISQSFDRTLERLQKLYGKCSVSLRKQVANRIRLVKWQRKRLYDVFNHAYWIGYDKMLNFDKLDVRRLLHSVDIKMKYWLFLRENGLKMPLESCPF